MKSSPNSELSSLEKAFAGEVSRYVVGIDLGTTNCAVAFVDTQGDSKEVNVFRLEQMIDISTTSGADTLPSFHYQLFDSEISGVERKHVFTTETVASIVGIMARQRGAELPGRAIASAKSWLCHKMVDRESDLLPWGGDEDVLKISPVEASRRYLEHIRRCWDRAFPGYPLRDQDTIVTLPASFDEIARRLTIVSAKKAGIEKLYLIEEPQAAFYAWLARNAENWTNQLRPGQTILVCDIGGGTTDFTLIRVTGAAKSAEETLSSETDVSRAVERELQSTFGLHRVAVGEHLMLGGDNLDIALAKFAEQKFCETSGQTKLSARQWDTLKSQCRNAKERFLGPEPPEEIAIHFPSSGRSLIGNFQSVTIELEQARSLLLTGFFGPVSIDAHPAPQAEGFQEFGLPYATEPNILKHLAEFLWEHRRAGRSDEQLDQPDLMLARPDWVLFNGGVLESTQVRDTILNQIATWFSPVESDWKPGCLDGNRLDLAVAQGAAYYGMVRRGEGVKIDATLARTYYLQVSQSPPKAICIMPASAHPGERFALEGMVFDLAIGEPVRFQLLSSNTRLTDRPGDLIEIDPATMNNMPPLQTVLRIDSRKSKRTIPVELDIELTEIGTLQALLTATNEIDGVSTGLVSSPSDILGDSDRPMQWILEFEARASTEQTRSAGMVADQESLNKSRAAVEALLGTEQAAAPKEVIGKLTEWLGAKKHQWEPAVLRELWSGLMRFSDYRKRSPAHEARWMNLLGWCLRPGFGYPGDEWRVGETWRAIYNKQVHRTAENLSETVILWRRISGGFTAGQQKALYQDVWPRVRSTLLGGSGASLNSNVLNEYLRLIGSLEWIEAAEKIQVTQLLLDSLARKKNHSLAGPILWAAGRLGCRVPVYANLQMIVPARYANTWADQLLGLEKQFSANNLSAVSLCLALWCRLTGDRYRDVDPALRSRVIDWMEVKKVSDQQIELVRTGGDLSCEDATSVMGEALPLGFTLR
ncbi:Hsp70 family protein [Pirellulaceae bacterium SH449]